MKTHHRPLSSTGVCVVGGASIGGISAGMSGGDVGDVFEGIGKGALNGLILGGGISLAVCGFGIGGTTILGSTMATYGLSISANMLEVAFTQGKKVGMMVTVSGLVLMILTMLCLQIQEIF